LRGLPCVLPNRKSSRFVRQLFGLGVVGIDALGLGFVGPFGFGEKLAGLGVVPCLIQS
jgi:hypothetical protein